MTDLTTIKTFVSSRPFSFLGGFSLSSYCGKLNSNLSTTNFFSVQIFYCVQGITGIFELNERKARRVSRNPCTRKGSSFVRRKEGFDIPFGRILIQSSDKDFTV